jgi:hypothetical protein
LNTLVRPLGDAGSHIWPIFREVNTAPEYTPFFVPEFGWVFLILSAVALTSVISGSTERHMKRNLAQHAPFRLLKGILVGAFLCGVAIGVGLLVQSEVVAKSGLWTAVALLAAFWFVGQRYRVRG